MKLPNIDQIFQWDRIIMNYVNNMAGDKILFISIVAAMGFEPLLHVFQKYGVIDMPKNNNKVSGRK